MHILCQAQLWSDFCRHFQTRRIRSFIQAADSQVTHSNELTGDCWHGTIFSITFSARYESKVATFRLRPTFSISNRIP